MGGDAFVHCNGLGSYPLTIASYDTALFGNILSATLSPVEK
jgi:hypothetical protein